MRKLFVAVVVFFIALGSLGYWIYTKQFHHTEPSERISGVIGVTKTQAFKLTTTTSFEDRLTFIDSAQKRNPTWSVTVPSGFSFLSLDAVYKDGFLFVPSSNEAQIKKLFVVSLEKKAIVSSISFEQWIYFGYVLFIVEGGQYQLYELNGGAFTKVWSVPHPPYTDNYAYSFEFSEDYIFVSKGKHVVVLERQTGNVVADQKGIEVIGISKDTQKLLTLAGSYLNLVSYDLKQKSTFSVASLVGLPRLYNSPFLLGKNGANWIFFVPTELPKTFAGQKSHTVPANHLMVAVNEKTHQLKWKQTVGKWPWTFWNGQSLHSNNSLISSDKQLNDSMLFHTIRDVPDGSGNNTGHLVFMNLKEGKIIWQSTYPDATRSNGLANQVGEYFYLRIPTKDMKKSALVQFKNGVLNNAAWLPEYEDAWINQISPQSIWFTNSGKHLYSIFADNFDVIYSAKDDFKLKDAQKWVKSHLKFNKSMKRQ